MRDVPCHAPQLLALTWVEVSKALEALDAARMGHRAAVLSLRDSKRQVGDLGPGALCCVVLCEVPHLAPSLHWVPRFVEYYILPRGREAAGIIIFVVGPLLLRLSVQALSLIHI